jgi:hypothetical protein
LIQFVGGMEEKRRRLQERTSADLILGGAEDWVP